MTYRCIFSTVKMVHWLNSIKDNNYTKKFEKLKNLFPLQEHET